VNGSSLLLNAQESTTAFYSEISSPFLGGPFLSGRHFGNWRAQIGWVKPLGGTAIDG
jgi:hypothetical protein